MQSLKEFACLSAAAAGLEGNLFLSVEHFARHVGETRRPQIRSDQAKGQSLWPPCCRVENTPFRAFQTACFPFGKSVYRHPVLLAELRPLACFGYFQLAFAYSEVSLKALSKQTIDLASVLSP